MPGKFEVKKTSNGQFVFNLKAANNEIILSSETYTTRRGAVRGTESVKKNAGNAARFEKKAAKNGEHYFILKASNGKQIGRSEMYNTAASMENGIESVKKNAPDAPTVDLTAG